MRRRAIVVLAAGAVLLGVAVVLTLSGSDYRTLDSNRVGYDSFVAEIPAGERACQVGELVPKGTGRVRITIADRDVSPTPPVDFEFESAARGVVARARLRDWDQGRITVPLARDVPAETQSVRWCVRNRGRVPVLLAGQPGSADTFNATIGHKLLAGRMRVDYLTRDKKTWWSQIGVIVDRFGLGKARHFSGSWPLWIALIAVLASWVLAVRLVLRMTAEERS